MATDQPEAPQRDPEQARWEYEQMRAVAERGHDQETNFGLRINEAAITSGQHALRALIIINGGAAVTMLAFIGHLVSANGAKLGPKLADLTGPLTYFAWGVALATLGAGLAYVTNFCIASSSGRKSRHYDHPFIRETSASKWWYRIAIFFQLLAIGTAVWSLIDFVYGMLAIRDAIKVVGPLFSGQS